MEKKPGRQKGEKEKEGEVHARLGHGRPPTVPRSPFTSGGVAWMKTRLRRSECVRVHVSSSVRTRAPMHVFESLSTLAFDFEPEKGIMECAVPSFFFLLFRVSSREGGGNLLECCSFLSLVYRFSICSLFFYLIIGKKLVLVRHKSFLPRKKFIPWSIHIRIYIQNYFQNTFQSIAFTVKSSSIRFTFSQTLNLPLRFKITSKILESTTNTNHLQTVRKKNFSSSYELMKKFPNRRNKHAATSNTSSPLPTQNHPPRDVPWSR